MTRTSRRFSPADITTSAAISPTHPSQLQRARCLESAPPPWRHRAVPQARPPLHPPAALHVALPNPPPAHFRPPLAHNPHLLRIHTHRARSLRLHGSATRNPSPRKAHHASHPHTHTHTTNERQKTYNCKSLHQQIKQNTPYAVLTDVLYIVHKITPPPAGATVIRRAANVFVSSKHVPSSYPLLITQRLPDCPM